MGRGGKHRNRRVRLHPEAQLMEWVGHAETLLHLPSVSRSCSRLSPSRCALIPDRPEELAADLLDAIRKTTAKVAALEESARKFNDSRRFATA